MTPIREKRVLDYIKRYAMAAPGQTVLVAVSGGADSMCLLDILQRVEPEIRLLAAHYNHGLRGADSDRDQDFVEKYCGDRNIPFFSGSGDVKCEAETVREGIEETARRLRYAFLQKTAEEQSADRIATAHNADDNVETVIMNIVRGTGLDGLCGIPPVRGNIIRPLLCLTRSEIEEYLSENNVPNIFDSTNDDQRYDRNRVRHSIVPILRDKNPELSMTVLSMIEKLRQDRECLDNFARTAFTKFFQISGGSGNGGEVELRGTVPELLGLPEAVRARVIRLALESVGVTGETRIVAAVTGIIRGGDPSGEVSLRGGGVVRREYGEIVFSAKSPDKCGFEPVKISLNTPANIPELGLNISFRRGKINNGIFYFKSSAICDNITVRPRRTGDKVKLAGRGCTKTLKKLFIEEKIPEYSRDRIPVIADGEGVIAVMGIGIAERCRPGAGDDIISMTVCKTGNNSNQLTGNCKC